MFVGTGTPRKPAERAEARRLRRDEGVPIKRIATRLGVSPSSVFHWTRDIQLDPDQIDRNLYGPTGPQNPEQIAKRMAAWAALNRERRLRYQEAGRARARAGGAPIHLAGCMLYWAEGAKNRNQLKLANSDPNMVRFFCEFLRECFDGPRTSPYGSTSISLTGCDRGDRDPLARTPPTPRICLRKHTINHKPTSSSGRKRNKLPYGVCTLAVNKTAVVQHVYGAIQEYAGFDEPRWLDGPPRKPRR